MDVVPNKGRLGLSRRDLLKAATITSVGALAMSRARASGTVSNLAPEFKVDIPGLPAASANVAEITTGDLLISSPDDASPTRVAPLSGPGAAQWGDVTITFLMPDATRNIGVKEWFDSTDAGQPLRKTITVTLHSATGAPLGMYTFVDAYPVEWSAGTFDYRAGFETETIVVRVASIYEAGG